MHARFRTNTGTEDDDIVAGILYLEEFSRWQIRTFTAEGLNEVIISVSWAEGECDFCKLQIICIWCRQSACLSICSYLTGFAKNKNVPGTA
jgi:hypothetical protein